MSIALTFGDKHYCFEVGEVVEVKRCPSCHSHFVLYTEMCGEGMLEGFCDGCDEWSLA